MLSPWVSALPCLWDTCVWGGSESMFWKKTPPKIGIGQHGVYLGCLWVSPDPWGSCAALSRMLTGLGRAQWVTGPRADLLLNLWQSLGWSSASPLPLQPRNHCRSSERFAVLPERPDKDRPPQITSCCSISVCDATELQHIHHTSRENTLISTEFTRTQPLPPAFFPLDLFPSLNSICVPSSSNQRCHS